MDVPVQFYQSVIAIELAITGGLLYQIGFFKTPSHSDDGSRQPYLAIVVVVVVVLVA